MFSNLTNSSGLNVSPLVFAALSVWALIWKGLALWKSARNSQKYWFVILLILNTLGIVEIIYLVYMKRKERKSTDSQVKKLSK